MPQSESLVVSETAMQNVFMVRWILKTCWALAMVMKEGFGKVSIQQKVLCAVNVLHGIWLPFCFLQWLMRQRTKMLTNRDAVMITAA
ncbi:hypothetical protein AAZX31_10G075300 [Glycine max]